MITFFSTFRGELSTSSPLSLSREAGEGGKKMKYVVLKSLPLGEGFRERQKILKINGIHY